MAKSKKSLKKILAAALGITLIVSLLATLNSLVGNPLSKHLAKNAVEDYIEIEYAELDLEVDSVYYSFKFGDYGAICKSPTSVDTLFSVYTDSFGNIVRDEYEYEVANNFSTYRRLDSELREIGEEILRKELNYELDNAIFSLVHLNEEEMQKLEKDAPLEIYNPPYKIVASVSVIDADVSYEKMAEILLAVVDVCKAEGVKISEYSVRIEYDTLVSVEDGAEARELKNLSCYNIPSEILLSEDLPKALEEFDLQ